MAITSVDNQVIYTGSGTTGPFDFDFKIFASSDLKVEKLTIATEVSETLAETTDYTVAIDGDGTGAVTLVATLSSAYKLVITRELPLTQEITYVEGDKFPSTSHEEALDRAAMRDQQLQEQIDRCVKVTAGGSVTPDELIDSLDAAVISATDAATAAETAQGLAEDAQAAAEAAAAAIPDKSTQAQAEAGLIDTAYMTPLKTAQAIAALGGTGKVLQVARYNTSSVATGTTVIPWDDTIPQNTEGDEYMTLAITPLSATSNLYIVVSIIGRHTATNTIVTGALFVDTTANALSAASKGSFSESNQFTFDYWVSSGSTSARTYKVRIGATDAGTFTLNGSAGGRKLGGVQVSTITIFEVAA